MKAWKGVIAGAAIVFVVGAVTERAGAAAPMVGPTAATIAQSAAMAIGMFRSGRTGDQAWPDGRSGIIKIKGLRGRGFSRDPVRRGMVFRGRSFPGDRYTYESATRGMGTRTYRFSRGDNARSAFDRGSGFRRETGMGGPTVSTFGLRRGLDGRLRLRKGFGRGVGFKSR